MEKAEHAVALREAMARAGHDKRTVADYVNVSLRTVSNWTSRKAPTMPSEGDQAKLRQLLGRYDVPGDPVEVAVKGSALVEWRQDAVISTYKRHLYEQRGEERAG